MFCSAMVTEVENWPNPYSGPDHHQELIDSSDHNTKFQLSTNLAD